MKKRRNTPRPQPLGAIFCWDEDDEQAIAPAPPQIVQPETTEFTSDLFQALRTYAPEGASLNAVGFDDINDFLRAGYKVTDSRDALVTVARGGEAEFAIAKKLATNKLVLCPTHDFTSAVTERYVAYDKAFAVVKLGKKPDAVVFDHNAIASPADVFGEIAVLPFCAFDHEFGATMRGEQPLAVAEEINSLVRELTATLKTREKDGVFVKTTLAAACEKAARLIEKTPELLHASGASQTYEAMRMMYAHEDRQMNARGETEMLLAMYLTDFYIKNVGAKKPLFPPDNNKRIDSLCEYLGADLIRATVYVSALYPTAKLKLCEYRCREFYRDILKKLFDLKDLLSAAFQVFKRLYPDDGFGLKSVIDPADIGLCTALAPDVFQGDGALSFFKQTGLLEKLIV